jgi:hypothetical protein
MGDVASLAGMGAGSGGGLRLRGLGRPGSGFPGYASTLPQLPAPNPALRRCFDKLDQEVKAWIEKAKLAA